MSTPTARLLLACVCLLGVLSEGRACLWDRDTLSSENALQTNLVEIIVGKFPRNTPAYYELRLARVSKQVALGDKALELFDDAAVACDRLGRPTDAMDWMRRKKSVMSEHDVEDDEHWYRYHANLGTFFAHRWLAEGTYEDVADLTASVSELGKAIAINPDAHFGRERYQILAIQWLINMRALRTNDYTLTSEDLCFLNLSPSHAIESSGQLEAAGFGDALKGISGLVHLGNGWRSPDLFYNLAVAAEYDGRNALGYLARLRVDELARGGARSALYLDGADALYSEVLPQWNHHLEDTRHLEQYYSEARETANAWQTARRTFAEAHFARGMHPDTHPEFWAAFNDTFPLPDDPGQPWSPARRSNAIVGWVFFCVVVAVAFVLLHCLYRIYRNLRAK